MEARKMGFLRCIFFIYTFNVFVLHSQDISPEQKSAQEPSYSVAFFGELYGGISTYTGRKNQEDFYYNHNDLRDLKLNYAQVLFEKRTGTWQFQLGIHDGVYVKRNYADQPKVSQLLSHANIQYSSPRCKGLKILAGIFPSHIGFESARTDANLTASRSMLAENSPYYESGIQINYSNNDKPWKLGVQMLTGWQQAQILLPVRHLSWGYNFEYALTQFWTLNNNGFVGYLNTQSNQKRFYQNVYTQFKTEKWTTIWGFDFGSSSINHKKNQWFSPVIIIQNHWKNRINWAFRYEYMQSINQPFILVDNSTLFDRRSAASLNVDYTSAKKWLWRLEYKQAIGLGYEPGNKDMNHRWNNLILLSLSKSFQLTF